MLHIYFFCSTNSKDEISCITILTVNEAKAYHLANKHFAKHKCKGVPQILAV